MIKLVTANDLGNSLQIDNNKLEALSVGDEGSAYVNETSNRSDSTNYTNTTGKAIFVVVGCQVKNRSDWSELWVNGSRVSRAVANRYKNSASVQAIVPPNGVYGVVTTGSVKYWLELK